MSTLIHDLHKFADGGLQLRLPVDLVPRTQYSRLTNAIPVIEGQLITRDGMTLIGSPAAVSFIYLISAANLAFTATIANTVYPHGLFAGEAATLNVIYNGPPGTTTVTVGTYAITIASITSPTQFTFTPGIGISSIGPATAPVFAEVTAGSPLNTLAVTHIDNLFRLNQAIQSYSGDRIATIAGRIFKQALPSGTFEELVGPLAPGTIAANPPGSVIPTATMGFSGRPMSIIEYRFTKDSVSWALFADQGQMYKYRPGTDDTQIEFVPLGNPAPTVASTASAGGVGNLNSTGGTGYDWRYTYVDGLALTESNPSPINMSSGGTSTTRPTAFTNPAIAGDAFFTSPANAIDGSLTTASTGTASASQTGAGTQTNQTSCQWGTWGIPAGSVTAVTMNVLANLSVSGSCDVLGNGQAKATLSYTYDGGITWTQLATIQVYCTQGGSSASTGLQTYSVTIPNSASFANFILRGVAYTTAHGRTSGGQDYSAQADSTILVYDINTTVTQTGSVNALPLVNKIGIVCITKSPLPQHTFINLYRRGGSLPDAWRFVSQSQVSTLVQGACGANTLEIDDNVSDTTLSTSTILQLDNDPPVTSVVKTNQPLSFIWGPVGIDARVLGCGDPARPESVYFCKPGNADAWPPQNFVETSDPGTPVIAGCAFNTRTFAFSRESIFELVEGLGTGSTYTPFRTPSAHGLYSPFALAVGPAMYFVAKDGIYETVGGRETSIVEDDIKPLFPTYDTPGQSVHGYEAVDMTQPDAMRLRYHNDELYFLYIGLDTGTRQILVYDILKKRWRGMTTSAGMSEVYSEPATTSSLLYGTNAGTVYQAGGNFDPSDLSIIENIRIRAVAIGGSLPTSLYYARVVRYTAIGAIAISYETVLSLSPTIGMQVTFPLAPAGTTIWRVFYGTLQGAENQYQEYTEGALPSNRTVLITTTGTSGTLPTTNVNKNISVVVRTGAHDQGAPLNRKQYGDVIFDLDPSDPSAVAPVTITPYINGEIQSQAALTVGGRSGRTQVPLNLSDYFAFNTEYEITWTRTDPGNVIVTNPILFQYDTLHFLEPASLTHWSGQPTSFAFPGFIHVRDCYIAIRSSAPVTLTVTIDGSTVQTYTLPSTAGQKLKQYVQFASNKGLLYQFACDSTQEFRLYTNDLEFRVKPWLGLLGYSVQRVIGEEVSA